MEETRLTLEVVKHYLKFPEIYKIFWKNWDIITEVDDDAFEYLVSHGSEIILPNVTTLSENQKELLRSFKGFVSIGVDYIKQDKS